MSDSWWLAHYRTFEKWFDTFDIKYAPLENYDRHEERTNALNKSENTTNSQKEVLDGTENTTTSNTQKVDTDTTNKQTTNLNRDEILSIKDTETVDTDTTNKQTTINDGTQVTTEEREDLGHDKVLSGGYTENGNSDINHRRTEEKSQEKIIDSHNVSGYNSSALLPDSQDTSTKNPVTTTTTDGKGTDGEHSDVYEKDIVYNNQTEHLSGKDKITTNDKVDNTETITGIGTVDTTTTTEGSHTTNINGLETITGSGTVDTTTTDNGTVGVKTDDTTTTTGEGSLTGKEDFNEEIYAHGNIGVTTSQQMLKSELDIQLWNEYYHIADLFINDLCVRVY